MHKATAVDTGNGFYLLRDGNAWCAVGPEFADLQRSLAGFGATKEAAVKTLQAKLRKAGWPDHSIPKLGEFTVRGE